MKDVNYNSRRVFQIVLVFTIVGGIGFAGINFYRAQFLLATTELLVAIISFAMLIFTIKSLVIPNFKLIKLIYILSFFSIMMLAISSDGVSITIMAWVVIIPPLSYLLLGVRQGFLVTLLFYGISAAIFFESFSTHTVMTEVVAYANLFLSVIVIWGVSHGYESASYASRKRLKQLAISDHLTGLYNRTNLHERFKQLSARAGKENKIICLALLDLDDFKSINDQFGHDTGDSVLVNFAQILKAAIRENGEAFRVGGEEFAIICCEKSELTLLSLMENIRRETEKITCKNTNKDKLVSVSAGTVFDNPPDAKLSEMMIIADRRMYKGKDEGRNIVVHNG